MTSKAYVSPEALALLRTFETEASGAPSRSSVAAHRAEEKADLLPRAERAVDRYGVTEETIEDDG
ncbi:MAG: hypothetical protein AAFO72_01520, partial [Pseudomonadota bacterium]